MNLHSRVCLRALHNVWISGRHTWGFLNTDVDKRPTQTLTNTARCEPPSVHAWERRPGASSSPERASARFASRPPRRI
jgi:hypothetical protein